MKKKDVIGTPIEAYTRVMFTNIVQRLARFLSGSNFTFTQIAALHLISMSDVMSPKEISAALNLSFSATSRMIDDLVHQKYLTRCENSEDRRCKTISLSKKGVNLLDDLGVERVGIYIETINTLPPEISRNILLGLANFKTKNPLHS